MTAGGTGRAPRWMLRRRLGRTFLAAAVLFVLLSGVTVFAAVEFAVTGNDVIYTWQPAVSTSQRLLSDLVNEETGVRGYLLTQRADSLRPYESYRRQEIKDTAALRHLLRHDRSAARRLDDTTRAIEQWRRSIAGPAIAAVRSGQRPAVSVIDDGQAMFDRIRTSSALLTDTVRARTDDARSARARDGWIAAAALAVELLLVLGGGVFVWRGLHRWVLRPIDALATQTREVAAGETHRAIVAGGPAELADLGRDVEAMRRQIATELTRAEEITEQLRESSEELSRSNADLQQFAYVASHDLSEPLRKVANFCQLLERQYGEQLDDRARQYIHFAVDGAKRMQVLITDLLSLSRVGRTTESFEPVDLDRALDQALANLSDRIEAAGARVDRPGSLPTVSGDFSLLTSLLENLVGNAVKYRREDVAPVVRIEVARDGAQWTFAVSDNGIGIDPQYSERIFAVFQRLHLRDQYGGTGIGLALCRRIVEFHGGHIWLDPVESAAGAIFRFTLPEEGGPRAEPRQ